MPHTLVCSTSALLGSLIVFSFGMWPESLTVLIVAMGLDYVTGITAALYEEGTEQFRRCMGIGAQRDHAARHFARASHRYFA